MTEAVILSQTKKPRRPFRLSLLHIGGGLTLMMLLLAVLGPRIAPQDPMQESYVGQSGMRYLRPPFAPGMVAGYPLGADDFGRDVLSRLLWGIAPTMNLVLVIAALRLSLGLLAGLLGGWSRDALARMVNTLIGAALTIPVLLVALFIIAALGARWGMGAFILGLALTGWAETARLVADTARRVRSQAFVEASRAMGANEVQMSLSHGLPHVLPLVWMQLAFEISSTLLVVAALGFLGYFINAVWMPLGDFTGIRAGGAPELGQMLGVSTLTQPWTALASGSIIFLIVLAFNLLGEGLRRRLTDERVRPSGLKPGLIERILGWLGERAYLGAAEWRRVMTVGAAVLVPLALMGGGGLLLWQANNAVLPETQLQLPDGQIWAMSAHDAQSSYWSALSGPTAAEIAWSVNTGTMLLGGAVIDGQGNLYLNGIDSLYSLAPDGGMRWQAALPVQPQGGPALTPGGAVVTVDIAGSLHAFSGEGKVLWTYQADPPEPALSAPVPGPSGLIYYTTQNFLIAVDLTGKRVWQIRLPTYSYSTPLPRLSPAGDLLFFEYFVIDSQTGATLFKNSSAPMERYLSGTNGRMYFRTAEEVLEFQPTENGAVMIRQAKMDTRALNTSFRFPADSGVAPSGNIWLLYGSQYEYARLVWTDAKGNDPQVTELPYRPYVMVGIDADGIAYVCGSIGFNESECRAVQLASGVVQWKQALAIQGYVTGGAIGDGRLYVTCENGEFIAIGK